MHATQIVELLARPTFPTHQHSQEKPSNYNHKRDTPTTLTAMTNSPNHAQRKKANNMTPHNLMASLSKPKHTHKILQSDGNKRDSSSNHKTLTEPNVNNNINLLRERDDWRHPEVTLYRDPFFLLKTTSSKQTLLNRTMTANPLQRHYQPWGHDIQSPKPENTTHLYYKNTNGIGTSPNQTPSPK
jgi:hypothetical protein